MKSLARKFLESYGNKYDNDKISVTPANKFGYPNSTELMKIYGKSKINTSDIIGALQTKEERTNYRYIVKKDGDLFLFSEYTKSLVPVNIFIDDMRVSYTESGESDKINWITAIGDGSFENTALYKCCYRYK